MTDGEKTELLLEAGRLLLEYNESTGEIARVLTSTAKALGTGPLRIVVAYGSVMISFGNESPLLETAKELRYNAAVQARVHAILAQVRTGALDPATALGLMRTVENDTPRYPRWLVGLLLGAAAASFARLLGADGAACGISAVSTSLGYFARQELARHHFSLFSLPLAAAFIGALLGGLSVRLGWTDSPEFALVVPALMLVPGPHLINGLFDLVDNYVSMSVARLGLAFGLLLASGLGVAVGIESTLELGRSFNSVHAVTPTLVVDMLLAGIATCGFAAFFNTPWIYVGWAAITGMIGHGARFLSLQAGLSLEAATFLGGLVIGILAALAARARGAPVAILAFAGAVTLIPGSTLYRVLAGALRIARQPDGGDPILGVGTLSYAFQATIVVAGLVLGLVLGMRGMLGFLRRRKSSALSSNSST